jgi:hypothetical protein
VLDQGLDKKIHSPGGAIGHGNSFPAGDGRRKYPDYEDYRKDPIIFKLR